MNNNPDPKNEKDDYGPNIERERLENEIRRDAEREQAAKEKEAQKSQS